MQTNNVTAVLEDLVETLEDGKKGFESSAERLESDGHGSMATLMRRFSQQRDQFSAELRTLASTRGEPIDESGSVGGALHRGWLTLADALTGSDPKAVLSAAEQGEDHAVAEYDSALEKELPQDVRTVIARQAEDIRLAHDEVRDLRDTFSDANS
jgi:uncharacterized protein (TIGR02284 family)